MKNLVVQFYERDFISNFLNAFKTPAETNYDMSQNGNFSGIQNCLRGCDNSANALYSAILIH